MRCASPPASVPGAIVRALGDSLSPLLAGVTGGDIPVLMNGDRSYATPRDVRPGEAVVRYAPAPRLRLSGFLWPEVPARLANTPYLWTERVGQGRVIAGALCASRALVREKFTPVMRSAGISLSPFNAWVVLKGLETLGIRMEAQSQRALELARWLEAHPAVERVHYPGLESHPQHALAMAQQSGRGGAVVSSGSWMVDSGLFGSPAVSSEACSTWGAFRISSGEATVGVSVTMVSYCGRLSSW